MLAPSTEEGAAPWEMGPRPPVRTGTWLNQGSIPPHTSSHAYEASWAELGHIHDVQQLLGHRAPFGILLLSVLLFCGHVLNSSMPVTSHSLIPQLHPDHRLSLYMCSLYLHHIPISSNALADSTSVRVRWKYNFQAKKLPKLQNAQESFPDPSSEPKQLCSLSTCQVLRELLSTVTHPHITASSPHQVTTSTRTGKSLLLPANLKTPCSHPESCWLSCQGAAQATHCRTMTTQHTKREPTGTTLHQEGFHSSDKQGYRYHPGAEYYFGSRYPGSAGGQQAPTSSPKHHRLVTQNALRKFR